MFATDLALKRFLACMIILVLDGVRAYGEGLPTNFAFVLCRTLVCSHVHLDVVLGVVSVDTKMTTVFAIVIVVYRMDSEIDVVVESQIAIGTINWFF